MRRLCSLLLCWAALPGVAQQLVVRQTSPGWVLAGSKPRTVWINGNFTADVTATYDGQPHAATFVNAHAVTIPLCKADQAVAGVHVITLTQASGSASTNLPALMVTPEMTAASQLWTGDQARLDNLIAKGLAGQNVTIATIGGSITAGAGASNSVHSYPRLMQAVWHCMFPHSVATIINAGIGSTDSDYGALRAQRDVLAHNPDLVIVEYAVNDNSGGEPVYGDTYEGLVRQFLDAPGNPAVMLLMMMSYQPPLTLTDDTAQAWQATIGNYYNVPMVSYHDAIAPAVLSGGIPLAEISASDGTHPTDLGHAYAAYFLKTALKAAVAGYSSSGGAVLVQPAGAPYETDNFEYTTLIDGADLAPTGVSGFVPVTPSAAYLYNAPAGYEASEPGSTMDFTLDGTDVLIGYWKCNGPMGRARVWVDGVESPVILDAWWQKAGSHKRMVQRVARGLAPGVHQVHIQVVDTRAQASRGNTFRLLCVGTGGADRD